MWSEWKVKILLVFLAILFSLGCSSARQQSEGTEQEAKRGKLQDYEKTFNPSDYDPKVEDIIQQLLDAERLGTDSASSVPSVVPDTVHGFRVQVLSTSDIEEANHLHDSISVMLPNEWVYVVYQTPYYKVRIGDYLSRIEANQMSTFLKEKGFMDAWIVPDRVLRPPPPKSPPPIVPEMQKNE